MRDENALPVDEQQRISKHEAVKGEVRDKVHAEISRHADHVAPEERAEAEILAESLKQKAAREVVETEVQLERTRSTARVSQIVDYVFYVIYAIIAVEIALEALGAHDRAGFEQFVDALSAPLLAPFRGLMEDPSRGRSELMVSYLFGLGVYVLLHMAVIGLLRLVAKRRVAL